MIWNIWSTNMVELWWINMSALLTRLSQSMQSWRWKTFTKDLYSSAIGSETQSKATRAIPCKLEEPRWSLRKMTTNYLSATILHAKSWTSARRKSSPSSRESSFSRSWVQITHPILTNHLSGKRSKIADLFQKELLSKWRNSGLSMRITLLNNGWPRQSIWTLIFRFL